MREPVTTIAAGSLVGDAGAPAELRMITDPSSKRAVRPLPARSASIASRSVSSPRRAGAVFPAMLGALT